jgi:hypothetical protein
MRFCVCVCVCMYDVCMYIYRNSVCIEAVKVLAVMFTCMNSLNKCMYTCICMCIYTDGNWPAKRERMYYVHVYNECIMYMYTYLHIYTYTHMYIYGFTSIEKHTQYVYANHNACTHIYKHYTTRTALGGIYMYIYVYIYVCVCAHAGTHVYMYTY